MFWRSLHYRPRLLHFVLLMLLASMLAACTSGPPTTTLQTPPAYPNAQNLQDRVLGPSDNALFIYKSVTFVTPDTPDAVLKFYKDTLKNDGWEEPDLQPDPSAMELKWVTTEQPPTIYWVDVQTTSDASGGTRVVINLRNGATN